MRVMVERLILTIVSFFNSWKYILDVPMPVHHESSAMSILIVDDELMQRTYLTEVLSRAGHTITCASNGKEAITAIKWGDFSIVLMDIHMPLMGGLEATQVIRSLENTRYLPILGMSVQNDQKHTQRCMAVGMDGHFAKPIEPRTLPTMILASIAAKRMQCVNRDWLVSPAAYRG